MSAAVRLSHRSIGPVVLGVLLIGGVALPLAILSGGPEQPRHRPSVRATGAVRAKVVDTTPVEGAVDLVVADEAVWVSGFGVLSRLDAATGRVVATVDVKGVEDFSRVAVGMGSVWVTADGGLLYRIDADTNRVLATIAVGGVISGVETGGGSVWVARTERGEIVCVDPPTDRVVGQPIRVGPGPGDVLYAYGALWVANTSPASLVRVDASSGAVTPQSWASDLAGRLAAGFGSIWEASGGDSVIRADPVTGRVLALIPVPRGSSVAIGASRVWVLGRPDANAEPSSQAEGAALWQIDPTRNDVVGSSTPVGARGSIALAARDGAVWIADYEGQTVTKLDVVPCSKSCEARDRISRVELPDGLSAERLAVGEGAVWAVASTANGSRSALVRIDPLTREVIATTPLPGHPSLIASGGGAVWIGDARQARIWVATIEELVRIDASSR